MKRLDEQTSIAVSPERKECTVASTYYSALYCPKCGEIYRRVLGLRRVNFKQDYDDIADEIEHLQAEKQKVAVDKAEREGTKLRIAEMQEFLDSQKRRLRNTMNSLSER